MTGKKIKSNTCNSNALVCDGIIVSKKEFNTNFYRYKIKSAEIVKKSQAGQFLFVKAADSKATLRRALAILSVDKVKEEIELYFEVKGEGTAALMRLNKGDSISLLGPLGTPFPIPKTQDTITLVAGGAGIAPILAFAEILKEKGKKCKLIYGARNADLFCLVAADKKLFSSIKLVTEDGSSKHKGLVTEFIDFENSKQIIYSCGPNPMMAAITKLSNEANIECLVSLETRMACGMGVCNGCVVELQNGSKKRCCVEGPVFYGKDIKWESL